MFYKKTFLEKKFQKYYSLLIDIANLYSGNNGGSRCSFDIMIRNRMICSQIFNISGRRLNLPTPPFFYLRTLGPIFPTRDIEDQTSYSVPKSSYQMTTCYLHYFPRKCQIGYSISKSSNKKFRTPLKAFVLSFPFVFFGQITPKIPF